MRIPDLEYLIDEAEEKQAERERADFDKAYYYVVEYVKSATAASGLMNRRELHVMEKEVRKQRELKKLKKIMGIK